MVHRSSVSLGREEAERDADEGREEHRADRELDRRREPLGDLLCDRPTGRDARPEVTRADRLQVAPVLLVERIVEAVLVADLGDRLVGGPLAEQRLRR